MDTMENDRAITVFIIATKNYTEYANSLILSIDRYLNLNGQTQIIVLTDSPGLLSEIEFKNGTVLQKHLIPSYGWPEATLLRFHLMADHWAQVTGKIVMYLDADTEIVSPVIFADIFELCTKSKSNGVTPVLHPGYFNRSWLRNAVNRTHLGPWENRRRSTAYVPIMARRKYVCGGVIWGLRESFFQMCISLKTNIDLDSQNGIVAKHNDESHLNNWFANYSTIPATPEWAFARGYSNLAGLDPRIEVIHKPSTFNRIPTKLD